MLSKIKWTVQKLRDRQAKKSISNKSQKYKAYKKKLKYKKNLQFRRRSNTVINKLSFKLNKKTYSNISFKLMILNHN